MHIFDIEFYLWSACLVCEVYWFNSLIYIRFKFGVFVGSHLNNRMQFCLLRLFPILR